MGQSTGGPRTHRPAPAPTLVLTSGRTAATDLTSEGAGPRPGQRGLKRTSRLPAPPRPSAASWSPGASPGPLEPVQLTVQDLVEFSLFVGLVVLLILLLASLVRRRPGGLRGTTPKEKLKRWSIRSGPPADRGWIRRGGFRAGGRPASR